MADMHRHRREFRRGLPRDPGGFLLLVGRERRQADMVRNIRRLDAGEARFPQRPVPPGQARL